MEKKKKTKHLKNYFILGTILVVAVLLVLYLCSWYKAYQNYQSTIPVIRGSLPEITEKEWMHYLQENETALLYVCTASNDSCRTFEADFKNLIKQKNLKDNITYLNISNENKKAVFLEEFNNNYAKEQKLTNYPALIYFKEGKVKALIQGVQEDPLSIDKVDQFLEIHQLDN